MHNGILWYWRNWIVSVLLLPSPWELKIHFPGSSSNWSQQFENSGFLFANLCYCRCFGEWICYLLTIVESFLFTAKCLPSLICLIELRETFITKTSFRNCFQEVHVWKITKPAFWKVGIPIKLMPQITTFENASSIIIHTCNRWIFFSEACASHKVFS